MTPVFKWVNHACFIYSDGEINLISDPWISGFAFNNGWSHVSDCQLTDDDWREITHIWISHEHPDHFSPASLKAIPVEMRRNMTVLYQRSADQRVAGFLRKCEFDAVIELDQGWVNLGSQTSVYCLPFRSDTNDDSALVMKTGEFVTVNFNDCYFGNPKHKEGIKAIAPKVDVLLAQFSYASWAGNPEDTASKKEAGHRAARIFMDNVAFFEPKYVIPCASNVWFSNAENFHLNEGLYSVRDIDEVLGKVPSLQSVVLYPREEWSLGDVHDNAASLARYDVDYAKINEANAMGNPVVAASDLQQIATRFLDGLREKNSRLLLMLLPKAKIYVHDLNQAFTFSMAGLKAIDADEQSCDVRLGSESLQYCLKFLWGGDTLNINGRFTKPAGGTFWHFRIYFAIAALNNSGIPFDISFVMKNVVTVAKKFVEYRFVQS